MVRKQATGNVCEIDSIAGLMQNFSEMLIDKAFLNKFYAISCYISNIYYLNLAL